MWGIAAVISTRRLNQSKHRNAKSNIHLYCSAHTTAATENSSLLEQGRASAACPLLVISLLINIQGYIYFSQAHITMEHHLRRPTIEVSTDGTGKVSDKGYEKYKLQTRKEYEDLMMEFEFRCRRAAMMNYYEASAYDRKVFAMEVIAAFIGAISATTVGMWFFQKQTSGLSFSKLGQLGLMGCLGLGAALFIELLGKGSIRIIPSLSKRQEAYIAAAAAWQRLSQETRSYRIQLDNPNFDVPQYAEWYSDIINKREKLCTMTTIPQKTYNCFNDPKKIYQALKQRRIMFLQFVDLETMDLDDLGKQVEPKL